MKNYKKILLMVALTSLVSTQGLSATQTQDSKTNEMESIISSCPPINDGFVDSTGNFVDLKIQTKIKGNKNRAIIVAPGTENFAIESRSRIIDSEAAIGANSDEKLIKLLRAGWFNSEEPEVKITGGTVEIFNNNVAFENGEAGCYQLVYYPDIEAELPGNEYAGLGVPANVVIHPTDGWVGNGASIMKANKEITMSSDQAIEFGNTYKMQGLLGPIETVVDESTGMEVTGAIVNGTGPLGTDLWIYDEFNTNTWYHGNPQVNGGEDLLTEVTFVKGKNGYVMDKSSESDFKLGVTGTYFIKSDWLGSSSAITKVHVKKDQAVVTANNATILDTDAVNITVKEELVDIMGAIGSYKDALVVPSIFMDDLQFANVQSGTPGVYDVTFSVDIDGNDQTLEDNDMILVKLTVLGGEITPDNKGYVDANNTIIYDTVASTIASKEELVGIMNATAAYGENILSPAVILSDEIFSSIKAGTAGVYEVSFAIDVDNNVNTINDNASKTVYLTVSGGSVTPDLKGYVDANDTTIQGVDAKQIASKEELVSIMNATAAYGSEVIIPNVDVDAKTLANIKNGVSGVYDVSFKIDYDNNESTLYDNAVASAKLSIDNLELPVPEVEEDPKPEEKPQPEENLTDTGIIGNVLPLSIILIILAVALRRRMKL